MSLRGSTSRCAALLAALLLAPAAGAEPRVEGPVTGGLHGFPFASTGLDLAASGYLEEEFFVSGTARAWTSERPLSADGGWKVSPASRAQYRTRILVRRPKDPTRFNGSVLVEWFNVSGGLDGGPDWSFLHELLLAEGFAWVGASAQSVGVNGFPEGHPRSALGTAGALRNWDPERYGGLVHPGDSYSYDIFSQVGKALRRREGPAPLGDLEVERLLAIGESQSAARLATYVNAVHPVARVYDGFLVHGRGGSGAPLSEAPEAEIPAPHVTRSRTDLEEPVITLESETDVILLDYYRSRQPDSERFRLWEVAGTAHADTYLLGTVQRDRRGPASAANGALRCELPGNSGPQRYVLAAALAHLDHWVRDGTPAPRAARLTVVPGEPNRILRDGLGNALGGIRTPAVDVPIAALYGEGNTGGAFCRLLGRTERFDAATLARLYPSREGYVAAHTQSVEDAVAAGFLLERDAQRLVEEAHRSGVGSARPPAPPDAGPGPP